MKEITNIDFEDLAQKIKSWGKMIGFQQIGITDVDLSAYEEDFKKWLELGYQGDMYYMVPNILKRCRPKEWLPYAKSIIVARLDYLPPAYPMHTLMEEPELAAISRYALGEDYHQVVRKKLHKLAKCIARHIGQFNFRVTTDSALLREKPAAERAGLGWIGNNTLIINRKAGSRFFLGTLVTDLLLPFDKPAESHCGSCTACLKICPTGALVAPRQLDARKCIAYLTIEYKGSIPHDLRSKMGNRVFGCDDCQIICPWNRYARLTKEIKFFPRENLDKSTLIQLFNWDEETYIRNTEGSALRRSGYECWLRNIAVALGNAPPHESIKIALKGRLLHPSPLVREHVEWALQRQLNNIRNPQITLE